MKPIKIYCMANQDRSDRVRWLLEEMQVPYENIYLPKKRPEREANADYVKLNPMARTPTIIDGDVKMFESAGICLYLADKYGIEKGLAPRFDAKERSEYLQWMAFSTGSLEAVVAWMFALGDKTEEQKKFILGWVKQQCEILRKPLNETLAKREFLLESGFSAADIIMAAVIPGAAEHLMVPGTPIAAYMERMMKRPAAVKTEVFA